MAWVGLSLRRAHDRIVHVWEWRDGEAPDVWPLCREPIALADSELLDDVIGQLAAYLAAIVEYAPEGEDVISAVLDLELCYPCVQRMDAELERLEREG